jgi:hypothetical protein
MTALDQITPRSTTPTRQRTRGAAHRPAREARKRRSFDGVVASYIRELAAGDTTPRGPNARN